MVQRGGRRRLCAAVIATALLGVVPGVAHATYAVTYAGTSATLTYHRRGWRPGARHHAHRSGRLPGATTGWATPVWSPPVTSTPVSAASSSSGRRADHDLGQQLARRRHARRVGPFRPDGQRELHIVQRDRRATERPARHAPDQPHRRRLRRPAHRRQQRSGCHQRLPRVLAGKPAVLDHRRRGGGRSNRGHRAGRQRPRGIGFRNALRHAVHPFRQPGLPGRDRAHSGLMERVRERQPVVGRRRWDVAHRGDAQPSSRRSSGRPCPRPSSWPARCWAEASTRAPAARTSSTSWDRPGGRRSTSRRGPAWEARSRASNRRRGATTRTPSRLRRRGRSSKVAGAPTTCSEAPGPTSSSGPP